MSIEEILQALVKSPALSERQLKLIANSLSKKAKRFEEMDYLDSVYFQSAFNAAIKLIITRLRDGQDPPPCLKNRVSLMRLFNQSSEIYDSQLSGWILENISNEYLSSNLKTDLDDWLLFVWSWARSEGEAS